MALHKELRELRIQNDLCPECDGELDTGFECKKCGFDAMPEAQAIDNLSRCKKCGDKMKHDDDGPTLCRWCQQAHGK